LRNFFSNFFSDVKKSEVAGAYILYRDFLVKVFSGWLLATSRSDMIRSDPGDLAHLPASGLWEDRRYRHKKAPPV
jgi:hypothetical protein